MDEIEEIRACNRLYTRELGLLGKSYLGSGLGVSEVRVLYELAHGAPAGTRTLAQRLALDEGYVSRVLRGFERRGWLVRSPDAADARRRVLNLTQSGRAAVAPLEEASRREIAARLDRLSPDRRARFLEGVRGIRAALSDHAPPEVEFRDLAPGDAGWVIGRHGALYAAEEGYDASFEALVAEILVGYIRSHDPAGERAWIAWEGGRRIGSVFCVRQSDDTAKLRLFLIEPDGRGRGLGKRMLAMCMDWARERGYARMVLWTHESHRAACALYAAAGWRMVEETSAHAFGQDVVDQIWQVDL